MRVMMEKMSCSFNINQAKASVLKSLDDKANLHFKKFFNGPLFDRLLNAGLLYFIARFMQDWLVKAMDRARKQHLEGYDPYVVAARLNELEEEQDATRQDLSPVYSEIILKYSKYDKPQHDKQFFENLVVALVGVLDVAFARLEKRADIEAEVGLLFRSKHFNMNHRRYQPPRSVDTLSVKELYCIKHETTNRALNAKMLSGLHEKPPFLAVQVASITNSPLITQFVQSPIVARAQAKDPAERNKLFKALAAGNAPGAGGTGGPGGGGARPPIKLASMFQKGASMHGVDVEGLKDKIHSMKASKETRDAIGVVGEERAYRSDKRAGPRGVIAPESVGLPADDSFNYLALLKRYVLYGPSLGMQTGQPVGGTPLSGGGAGGLGPQPSGGSISGGMAASFSAKGPAGAAPFGGFGGLMGALKENASMREAAASAQQP